MPRTKAAARSENNVENVKPKRGKLVRDMIDSYLKMLENEMVEVEQSCLAEQKKVMLKVHTMLKEECLKFPHSVCKTIAELKFEKVDSETTLFKNSTINSTQSRRKTKNHNYTSRIEDASLRSKAQSNIKKAKNSRASRSLSRTKLQQALTSMSSFNTPAHTISSGTFGLVTPKVKPNTPQVVLRRPQQGEIAISMQGSPLMVSGTTCDEKANVNIPLPNGRILSIQPQRGLRMSQIPDIDPETQRQIETLRDNLNKVCAFSARR